MVEKVVRRLGVQMRVMGVGVEGQVDKVGMHPGARTVVATLETGVQGLRVRSRGHPSRTRVVVRVVDGQTDLLERQLAGEEWEMLIITMVLMEQMD